MSRSQTSTPTKTLSITASTRFEVMMLVTEWRKLGIDVGFDELAKKPTLNGWWDIIDRRLAAVVSA